MEPILAIAMMLAMSLAFVKIIIHYANKRIKSTIIIYTTQNQFPYDWETEEAFDDIVKHFNN